LKRYMMITPTTLTKLGQCFSNPEEIQLFIHQMDELASEVSFSVQMRKRVSDEDAALVLLKQVAMFTVFCREYMDLVQQLVANLDCKEITEEEKNKMQE
jgi:hypothetical protein